MAAALACAALIGAVAAFPLLASSLAPRRVQATISTANPLTRAQIIRLIEKYSKPGPAGPQGPAGQNGTNTTGGPPSGPAGGDLAGTYPNPSLAPNTVDTANFKSTAKAPDASLLDGIDSIGFLQNGGTAGGDLAGTYPDPSIATGAVTDAKVAAANKDGAAGVPSLRTLGTGALQAMPGNATPGGPPSGAAGGDLAGTYPNPSIAAGAVTDAKVAAANKDGAAGVPSLRTLGTGALQAMPGNATPGGPPSGAAGGALAGTYPNPSLNVSGGPCANGQALTDI